MYGRMQEDVAWARLQDLQREMENAGYYRGSGREAWHEIRLLFKRAWLLAGLASRRAPRRSPAAARKTVF